MANKAREMGTNFINNVVSFMQQLPGKIKQYLDSAINNLKTWVTQMGQKGKEAVQSLINNVVEAAKSIPAKMAEIGKSIVEGVWNGIQNAASWFTNQVKGFFSGIVDGVKDALGIGSPSKVMADQVGKWMPAGVATGFEKAMPAAMRNIQTALNKGIDSVEADDISISAKTNVESFSNKLKNIYEGVATWFETIEYRIGGSIDRMTESLASLIQMGGMVVNSDGALGYVGYNGFGSKPQPNPIPTNHTRGDDDSGGDTYNFYSPKPIDEIEAARQLKKTKRDLSEGF
jgi:phage-related protein